MKVFAVPNGQRIRFYTKRLGIEAEGAHLHVDRSVTVEATATDEYDKFPDGTVRRRFVDVAPRLDPKVSDLWLDNAELDDAGDDPARVFNAPRITRSAE